jgi:hypothetical protein
MAQASTVTVPTARSTGLRPLPGMRPPPIDLNQYIRRWPAAPLSAAK